MSSLKSSFTHRFARLSGWSLASALLVSLAPGQAQAQDNCERSYECEDGDWFTVDWCYQGSCKSIDRLSQACKVKRRRGNSCWWDQQCNDGNPNTVNWCEWDWWTFRGGQCYSAPRDGSACEQKEQPPQSCRYDLECGRRDRTSRAWCYEGKCYDVKRNEASCVDEDSYCWGSWNCGDGDRNTIDWCHRGRCYHVPKDGGGGSCEPKGPLCVPENCPDDQNECTKAACDDADQCAQQNVANGTTCSKGQCNEGTCVECVANTDCAAATPCTQAGTCVNNRCEAGAPVLCEDDGNPCTAHACNPEKGCETTPVADGTDCGDGLTCQSGKCVPPTAQCPPVEVVVEHTRRGAVNNPGLPGGQWKVKQNSYQLRTIRFNGRNLPATTNYHCFDFSGVSGTLLGARIEMTHSGASYQSPDPAETVVFRPLKSTPCDARFDAAPDKPPADHAAIFADLNSGDVLAQFEATSSDNGKTESFPVTAAGLASLQAALGQSAWGMGGNLSTGSQTENLAVERIFRGTNDVTQADGSVVSMPSAKVILTVRPDSCEPKTETLTLAPVDLGEVVRAYDTEKQKVVQSFRFKSGAGEHQRHLIGNQNLPGGFLGTGNIDRRAYFVFDVGSVNKAVSATLRIWGWQPSANNARSGVYSSKDPSETVGFFEVSTPASEIISAPFNDNANHAVDVPIWKDLGDGTAYGERVYTAEDGRTDLIPSPYADPNTPCNPDESHPCGKWIEIELNAAALAAINAAGGQWTIGAALTSVDARPGQREFTNAGNMVDLSPAKGSYPAYRGVAPQLVIKTQ